jgi:hypothetical protein
MMALGLLNTERPLVMWNHDYTGNATDAAPAWPGDFFRASPWYCMPFSPPHSSRLGSAGTFGTSWDAFFQMHLLSGIPRARACLAREPTLRTCGIGAYPTVPSPWGDHTNVPNPETDGLFQGYAPLWSLLRGTLFIRSSPRGFLARLAAEDPQRMPPLLLLQCGPPSRVSRVQANRGFSMWTCPC